ncbi:MAG: alanine--tRNA ligase, partial [Ureaplasma sp.]|nr:alanine--tRNA ligase [Ureaplasma sp.]
MKKMSSNEIRQSWINFFETKKHLFLTPVSLIPNNDPSLLWINSGVATLKDYFSGKQNPPSQRLVNCQKAIRTNDIFNVGKTSRHQTMFEMLGNFSIGDYFKIEAINFAFELLTKVWDIEIEKLWITVFKDDELVFNEWLKLGIPKERILKCDRDRNFWDIGSGPCGGCSEIYYDRGEKYDFDNLGEKLIIEDIENDRYIEIWNIVFSEFNNEGNGNYTELSRKNIDTGAGLERIASISQDTPTNFETDLFFPIIQAIQEHSNKKYDIENYFKKNPEQELINFRLRVMADHLRATLFAISDGAIPSNKDRGYIIRRLIRRAMVCAELLGIQGIQYIYDAVDAIISIMVEYYPYLKEKKQSSLKLIVEEYETFKKTLSNGLKYFNKHLEEKNISPEVIFEVVTTYGFPIELIKEICEEKNIEINLEAFEQLYKHHQEISNSKNNVIGIEKQNAALVNLDVESKFDYYAYEMLSKVVKLFDKDFNEVNQLNNQEGYVIFDQTPFYATSGGQICDTGFVNDIQFVDDVIKCPNLQHLHHSNNFCLSLNEEVSLKINKKDREILKRHHSSEHLLHAALKNIVSDEIKQEGAFKSTKKITFDFSLPRKLEKSELQKVEDWVNEQIGKKINVNVEFMSLEEAKAKNAAALFENVYKKIGDNLRVINMEGVSLELCGGTHVDNLNEIEKFNIIDYYSKGAGSWRIEAIATLENIENLKREKIQKYNEEILKIQEEIIKKDPNYDLTDFLNHISDF